MLVQKPPDSNSYTVSYVVEVGDNVWWSVSHGTVFYFYLQVSKFLSSAYLGAKDSV